MWFGFQGIMLHASYNMKYPQPDLLVSLVDVLYMFRIIIWYGGGNLIQLVSCVKFSRKLLVMILKTNHSKLASPLLLLTFCFIILGLHGFLSATINSSLMFKNCVIPVCVMINGIILQYAHNCMDIYLEKNQH